MATNSSFNFFLPLTKVEKNKDGSVTVSGYASTPALDLDGEIVSLDAVKAALPGYWEWRNIREMHQPSAVGVGQEASVDDKGLFLRAKITDREAAKKCLDGVYKGYSIGGRKLAKTGNTITEIDLIEISVVDRPANPECKIEVAKRAGLAASAHLVKFRAPMTPQSRALKKMAQAVESLAKEGPPAARDGFSLPAKPKAVATPTLCKKHGVADCAKCAMKSAKKIKKREFTSAQRQSAAQSGAALPDGSFPIKNKKDLSNARQAVGRAKNPSKARAHIRTRAAALGVKLPDKWSKKEARALIATAEKSAGRPEFLSLAKSLQHAPSFLTLGAERGSALEGDVLDLGHGSGLGELGGLSQEDDIGFLDLGKNSTLKEERKMDGNAELSKAIRRAMKAAGRQSPTARIIGQARGNLKKARKAASDMEECVKAAHGLLKSAYLSKDAMVKAGKKPKDDGDADDMDMMGKVMGELNKAFGSAQTMKTFIKAANGQLKKAVGRSGQRGQEVSDPEGEFYRVPPGIRDMSVGDLAGAAPGTAGGGSQPPMYPDDGGVYPGKSARKMLKGMVSATEAEALARAAAAEAKVEVLGNLPATTGRRPYAFDVTKAFGGEAAGRSDSAITTLLEGVDTKAIGSGDELAHTTATAKMFGNMVLNGHGKSIMSDPEFRGGAGKRAGN